MRRRSSGSLTLRLLFGLAIAIFSVISYLGSQQVNPVTGESQYVSLTPQQEIRLGIQSAPELVQKFGGAAPSDRLQQQIDTIGEQLVRESVAADTPWQWEFTVLDDPNTVNAFALPGGPIFITTAMLNELETENAVAGVLSHEIVHVLARHGSQRLAKSELTNGLVGAVAVASDSANAAQTAAVVGQLINTQYSREDELESDRLGVCIMRDAGYDPEGLLDVMEVLARVSGGARQPEFFSTHPNPDNRLQQIREAIAEAPQFCPQLGAGEGV